MFPAGLLQPVLVINSPAPTAKVLVNFHIMLPYPEVNFFLILPFIPLTTKPLTAHR